MSGDGNKPRVLLLTEDAIEAYALRRAAIAMAAEAFGIPAEAVNHPEMPASLTCATCRHFDASFGNHCMELHLDLDDQADFGCVKWEAE